MPSTDERPRQPPVWPSEIKWTTVKVQLGNGAYYSYEEFQKGWLYMSRHGGGFMRVEVAHGEGALIDHILVSMQLQAKWSKEDMVKRVRDALVGMGLFRMPGPEPEG